MNFVSIYINNSGVKPHSIAKLCVIAFNFLNEFIEASFLLTYNSNGYSFNEIRYKAFT